jgi:hypothetical protein
VQVYVNLDSVAGFEASTSIDDERFCQINEEVLLINRSHPQPSTLNLQLQTPKPKP